jgi:hypothetical protein
MSAARCDAGVSNDLALPVPLVPMRTEPWPAGKHAARPCPICGGGWIPWAFSRLPCHGRCLFSRPDQDHLLDIEMTDAVLADHLGVTLSVVRAARGAARRRRDPGAR